MKHLHTKFLITLLLALVMAFAVACGDSKPPPVQNNTQLFLTEYQPAFLGEKGVRFWNPKVSGPSGQTLIVDKGYTDNVEAGIEDAIAKAVCAGYDTYEDPNGKILQKDPGGKNLAKYNVMLKPGVLSKAGNFGFKIELRKGDPLYDSEFDQGQGSENWQDHFVVVAGQYIAAGSIRTGVDGPDGMGGVSTRPGGKVLFDGNVIALPATNDKSLLSQVRTAADHETEHVLQAWYAGDLWLLNRGFHVHPLIEKCPGASLTGGAEKKASAVKFGNSLIIPVQ